MFEVFEHTADIGLRVRAPTLAGLFTEAARGLFSLIVENLESIQSTDRRVINLNSDSLELLLFDWLDQLLYIFDTEHLIFSNFDVSVDRLTLSAIVQGETLDYSRHTLGHEVKAITYHDLKVIQTNGEWLAEIIVDI